MRRLWPWLACASALAASTAQAHGRQPSLGQLAFDPADPTHLVVRATWGLLTSHDDGASFSWTCATAVGFDRTIEDPRIAVMASGRVLASTFDGLARSDASGCSYDLVTDPALEGLLVIDVENDPFDAHGAWLATSPGDRENTILHTSDEGESYELRATFPRGTLLERVMPSPSDPMRVYASGVVLATATEPRRAYVWRSSDGGRTFDATEIPLVDVERTDYGERNVHVLGVDPTSPDILYARTVRRTTDTMDERLLRSADGGATFVEVARMPEITGLAIDGDGHVWAGSWYGGFYRSDDRGAAFDTIDASLRVRCLSFRPGQLWVCTDDVVGPFALGRSSDLGEHVEQVWRFEDATNEVGCPMCTEVGLVCPSYWPDVQFDLGLASAPDALPPDPDASAAGCIDGGAELDAGIGMDGGAGAPSPAPTCGCRAGRGGSGSGWASLLLVLVLVRRRALTGRARNS